jgi:hypothetical protein
MARKTKAQKFSKMIGMSIILASLQFSIASVEMSSKFSVASFSTNDDTLQRAADALRLFMYIAIMWTVACSLVMYSTNGWLGALSGLLANALIVAWIFGSYYHSFVLASKRNKVKFPCIFGVPKENQKGCDENVYIMPSGQ